MGTTFVGSSFPPQRRRIEPTLETMDIEQTSDLPHEPTADLVTTSLAESRADTPRIEPVLEDSRPPAAPARRSAPAPRPRTPEPRKQEAADPVRAAEAAAPAPTVRAPVPIEPGRILLDRYLLERQIGKGGTALVFRARDLAATDTARQCIAIKTPRLDVGDKQRAGARLRHEFECAHQLAHANVVRVYDLHIDREPAFMTMELVEGRSLAALMRMWIPFPPVLARSVLRASAAALLHAHRRGVVHGDFKPGNVFLTHDEQVKVLDFGAAARPIEVASERIAAATPTYSSPEVLEGQSPEASDDVFSFACVAYELLTGRHPFDRRPSVEARDADVIPPRAWSLAASQWLALLSALAWDRRERSAALESLVTTLTTEQQAAPVPPVHRIGVPEKRAGWLSRALGWRD